MCGICGIVDYEGDRLGPMGVEVLQPVIEAMRHRGPDASGMFCTPPAVLGSTRLAILDLSHAAAQPMTHQSGALTMVFNGEIYNYVELRRELEMQGDRFMSNSDTEVLLAMYARLGPACLPRLRGMFSFAVWHHRERKLFLARDPVGEKPLVYFHQGKIFAFASEIPALLQLKWIPRRVDAAGLHLGLFYVHAPAPWTAFRDIRRLPPGSWMEVTYEGVRSGTYWSCRFEAANRLDDLDAAATAVTRGLDETTRLMCRSDVPVGAALSGGLDSGAVVDSMSRALSGVHTFRISGGFDSNPEEYAASERIAQWCGTQHHQCSLPPDCVISFTNVASIFGEPISSPVILDALELAKQARSHATVLLTGTGGDELFGGYPDHWVLRRLDRERALRRRWHVGTVGRAGSRPANQRRADLAALRPGRVFGELKFSGLLDFTQRVYAPRMKEVAAEHDPVDLCETVFLASGAESLVDGFLAQELTLVNQYSLTSILDAAGMHHSLEFRSPFLDVNMIELSLRIPSHFKIGPGREGMNRKLVLRRAMQNRLPPQTVLASTKTGFGGTTPYGAWLRGDKEAEFHRRLTSPALNDLELFDTRALEELALLSTASSAVPLPWLWGVAMISGWLERYF